MCGIAGKISYDHSPDIDTVRKMTDRLRHRGPDAGGICKMDDMAVFGHRRLSIIDLSENANQPMTDSTGRYTIVYNGEVYNYPELKRILDKKYCFATQSDTEVVLYAFIEWGTACFAKFNGMFALAIWDSKEKTLVLARDRFGKKPLYYTLLNREISFASELGALLKDEQIKDKISVSIAGLNHYLAMGYILSPFTIYNEISKLEPATFICFSKKGMIEKTCYWNYADGFRKKISGSQSDIAENLDYLIHKAVKYRMISDVPVGAFLSGGLDSGGITAYMKKQIPYELHTFSLGFAEASYNESEDAKIVAGHLGTFHHEIVPYFADNEEMIKKTINCYDEPFSDTSLVPFVLLSEFAAGFVKVVLSGDGADEIFGGYLTYKADYLKNRFSVFPQSVQKCIAAVLKKAAFESNKKISLGFQMGQFAKGIGKDPQYAHYAWRELHNEEERIALIGKEHADEIRESHPFGIFSRYYEEVKDLDFLSQHLYVDAKTWLCDDILVKVDRATMAFGLEARAPYLDYELAEYAASIPSGLKINRKGGKYILRKTLEKYLPEKTIRKKKSGFNAPINDWLKHSGENEFRYFNRYVLQEKGLRNAEKTA